MLAPTCTIEKVTPREGLLFSVTIRIEQGRKRKVMHTYGTELRSHDPKPNALSTQSCAVILS